MTINAKGKKKNRTIPVFLTMKDKAREIVLEIYLNDFSEEDRMEIPDNKLGTCLKRENKDCM